MFLSPCTFVIIIIPIIVVFNIWITFFAKIDHWSFTCFYKIDWKMMTGKETFKLLTNSWFNHFVFILLSFQENSFHAILDAYNSQKIAWICFWHSINFPWPKLSLSLHIFHLYPCQFLKTGFMMLFFDEMQLSFQNLPSHTYLTLLYVCT